MTFMEIIKKDMRKEALRRKAEQAQQPQGYLAVNLTRKVPWNHGMHVLTT